MKIKLKLNQQEQDRVDMLQPRNMDGSLNREYLRIYGDHRDILKRPTGVQANKIHEAHEAEYAEKQRRKRVGHTQFTFK